MPEISKREELTYKPTESTNHAILGKLTGPCADVINCTRNGRRYSNHLWETVLNDELVKEQFANGGIFGELGHPETRLETDMEKIAVCMPKPPVKNKDGLLIGTWDILDTPNGKILKTLVDYGYKVGISSRGDGEVYETSEGEEVDGDSYVLKGFDIVIIPAVKAARLEALKESIGGKTLKQTLLEQYNSSNDAQKKVIDETLDTLGIKLMKKEECVNSEKSCADKEEKTEEKHVEKQCEAVDDGAIEIIKCLQEALTQKKDLETKVLNLQNQLAVSDTKVERLNEDINTYKEEINKLTSECAKSKELGEKINALTESLQKKDSIIRSYRNRVKQFSETCTSNITKYENLNESLNQKSNEISRLKESLNASNNQVDKLQNQLHTSKETLKSKIEEFNQKIAKANKLIESCKSTVNTTIDRYIKSKAIMLGVTPQEITNRLTESYTIDDIDKVCEDLKKYTLNISSLPFSVDNRVKKVTITESVKEPLGSPSNPDDMIDESLLTILNEK